MTNNQFKHSVLYKPNENNVLGLFRQGNVFYQLIGFFNFMDEREYKIKNFGKLPFSKFACSLENGFGHVSRYKDDGYFTNKNDCTISQLKHFGLDTSQITFLNAYFNICYVFKVYQKPISIGIKFANSKEQAISDYFYHNLFIPQIMSENRLAIDFSNKASRKDSSNVGCFDTVDKSLFEKSIDPQNDPEILKAKRFQEMLHNKYSKKSEINTTLKNESSEKDFTLLSDYKTFSEENNIDLFEIRNKIIKKAKLNFGFKTFTYKNINYDIPLLPLLAWCHSLNQQSSNIFKIHNLVWTSVSPKNIKTQNDNQFHSDWWIGAGFPINLYNDFSYQAFNKAISNFAFNIVGKNNLNEVIFLSGGELPDVKGKLVKYPLSINDFDENDIILLKNGSIEFDLYLKKACKQGNGAVILEVGNKASHLTIVANEYNNKSIFNRIILLPDADKLLNEGDLIKICPKNKEIIIL